MATGEIVLYGTNWCSDCKRAKQFLGEQRVAYRFVDVDADREGLAYVESVNGGRTIIPVILFPDGSTLVEPSNRELADKLGLQTAAKRSFYDLIVIGGGPAGIVAALYAAREGIDTLVVERAAVGGQAAITEQLDNFPGFPEGISGAEFASRLKEQAARFGVEMLTAQEVASISRDGDYRVVRTEDGHEYAAWALLVSTGSTYRRLGVPGESDFIGAGIHFCATCDGPFYRDRDVMVIGSGNSAGQESIFLTRFARSVTIVSNKEELTASKVVQESIAKNPKITVLTSMEVTGFAGDGRLESVTMTHIPTGETRTLHTAGVFVFIGLTPNSGLAAGTVDLDPAGFIVTDAGMQSSLPGVFAAGDVRAGSTKQAVAASGEGAAAALAIRRYLEPLAGGLPRR